MSVSVTIDKAARRFDAFTALKGVSLTIEPGELVALLGPSGSGKTTLLRLIAGLDEPDGGTILFDGVDSRALSLRERRIGFVFQNYALFRHLTVAGNIAFGLKARPRAERPSRAEIATRIRDLLDLVQLQGLDRRFPSQLSGGQRQRVALARALAIEPRILLLDEPFGALDAKVRKDLRQWLRDLHSRTGHTTVFVTHDQDEALELADRVAILNQGQIEQVGTPDAIYDYPATPFVCGFLGDANRLPVELRAGQALFAGQPIYPAASSNRSGQAHLYVRPHHLKFDHPDRAPLSGLVQIVRRHGAIRRVEVAIRGLATRLDVDVHSQMAPSVGERVGLRITGGHLFAAA
ncbi:MAG: sulfate/molybdate ABC transporter ATP-binding protein [Alphaproteobacteria bacterium]